MHRNLLPKKRPPRIDQSPETSSLFFPIGSVSMFGVVVWDWFLSYCTEKKWPIGLIDDPCSRSESLITFFHRSTFFIKEYLSWGWKSLERIWMIMHVHVSPQMTRTTNRTIIDIHESIYDHLTLKRQMINVVYRNQPSNRTIFFS